MNDLQRSAMEQALEALEMAEFDPHSSDAVHKAITALRAALAEPVQEPVAWMTVRLGAPIQTTAREDVANEWAKWGEVQPLYTTPPQRSTAGATYSDVVSDGGMDPR